MTLENWRSLLSETPDEDLEEPIPSPEEARAQERLRDRLFRLGSEFMPTTRDQIVGIDNILGEIDEIIHWLRHSKEYGEYDSRLQPGAIFAGSPGTGKTLVSRWIATESGALFINVRDFVHNAALFHDSDIRDLFARARASYAASGKPILLFWDEFENSAEERTDARTTPEQRSVVSQLTAELDGIHGKNQGILLIGCTNHLNSIDEALMRRGRMGVHYEFHPPDRAGKEKILRYYLSQTICEDAIDISTLSYFFPRNNTAADIEEACVEAWRLAVRRAINAKEEPALCQEDLVKVFIKQLVGPPTTFVIPDAERIPIAIHECGHAIVALAYGLPLRLITVQPGKKFLGCVMVDDLKEYISSVPEHFDRMRMSLGGIAGERTAGLAPMVGATNDIAKASDSARFLVDDLAAGGETGILNINALHRTVGYSTMTPQISEKLLAASDRDISHLVQSAESDACRVLRAVGQEKLYKIATAVNERVTMTGNEFRDLFIEICGDKPESLR